MPPPSCISKISTRSNYDHERETEADIGRSAATHSYLAKIETEGKGTIKNEAVGIAKRLLGPSLEDAVLRTLEFGKSLMQNSDDVELLANRNKKLIQSAKKDGTEAKLKLASCNDNLQALWEGRSVDKKAHKIYEEGIKRNSIAGRLDKKNQCSSRKFSSVSKIRSLDSDLKRDALSPEKIKKQLQALIQINKDEPPEHIPNNPVLPKKSKPPLELTIMPTMCNYRNETALNCCPSQMSRMTAYCGGRGGGGGGVGDHDYDAGTSRGRHNVKRRSNKMRHAPEFLSNALGPTIDVSIIDNLKMMKNILNYDSGKGEGPHTKPAITQGISQEVRLQNSEAEMTSRIEELQKKIEELESKEQCLVKQIDEEELEREEKRKAFKKEEENMVFPEQPQVPLDHHSSSHICCHNDVKYEGMQSRIACEEEKYLRLKSQIEHCKRELSGVKEQKEHIKINKCLLDAWDVFASRVCHTRLPSFSRTLELKRKQLNAYDSSVHCCFPDLNPGIPTSRQGSRSDLSHCGSGEHICESTSKTKFKIKSGEIQFPIQRDIHCGLHQLLKTCCCSSKTLAGPGASLLSSEEELFKKIAARQKMPILNSGDSGQMLLKKPSGKVINRSRSDTTLRRDRSTRIVKVLWAITRINVFQNNCRTYEIMDTTSSPPSSAPVKTEGIFVVKTHQKKSASPTKKKYNTGY